MGNASLRPPSSPASLWWQRGAQLFALTNLALAAPLFDLLARQPTFFVTHRLGLWDAVLVSVVVSFGLPLVLLGLERVAGRRFGGHLHAFFVVLLAAALGSRVGKMLPIGDGALGLTLLFALAARALLQRPWGRSFLTVMAPLSLAIPVQFWLSSGVASLGAPPPLAAVPEITTPETVIMIVLDELPLATLMRPNGQLNHEMFPALAAFASRSTWYPNAVTVAQFTNQAVPAMLTGAYVDSTRQPTVANHPRNLFTLLGEHMEVRGIETATALCPTPLCPPRDRWARLVSPTLASDLGILTGHLVLPRLMTRTLPPVDRAWAGFADAGTKRGHQPDELTDQVDEFLAMVERDAATPVAQRPPRFYFLHLLLPHTPWRFLPDGTLYPHVAPLAHGDAGHWLDDPWLVRQARQRHVLQAMYVDHLLDRIFFQLRKSRTFHRSMIIVASDHGYAFVPGEPTRTATPATLPEIVSVPLFVKYPKQTSRTVDERTAETIDIAPTVLDLMGVDLRNEPVDGESLLVMDPVARRETVVFQRPTDQPNEPRTYAVDRQALMIERIEPARRLRQQLGQTRDEIERLVPVPGLLPYLDKPVAALPKVDERLVVNLQEPGDEVEIGAEDDVLPLLVAGKVSGGSTNRQIYVAVAVDGVVRAFTRTAPQEPRKWRSFQALLPASVMTPGRHQIEAFALFPNW